MTRTKGARSPRWTDDELATLEHHYPEHGPNWDGWSNLLPGRTQRAIANKAAKLSVTADTPRGPFGKYTPRELEIIRRYYPLHGPDWDGWSNLLPGRGKRGIASKAAEIGALYSGGRWTANEDAAVVANYPTRGKEWPGWDEVLPGRSYSAISQRARSFGIRKVRIGMPATQARAGTGKWTREQADYLLFQLAAIARRTGHNAYEVVEMMNRMQGKVTSNG